MTAASEARAHTIKTGDRRSRLTRGVIAGVLATAAEAGWTRAQVTMLGGREPVFTPTLMVHRMVLAATGNSLDRRVARALGVLMRSGYGPSWAAAYALVRGGGRLRWGRDTCILSVAIWIFEIATLPILRATPPLRRWPLTDIALDLSNALVFAAVANAVMALQEWSPHKARVSREVAGPRR